MAEQLSEKEIRQRSAEKDKKPKKRNWFVRMCLWIGRKFKEVFSELKKVTWPKFPHVMKQTGIVVAVVLFFLAVIFAFDLGLSQLYRLLIDEINSSIGLPFLR